MDITKLRRDPGKISDDLVSTRDNKVMTKQGCKVYFPARFGERGLAFVGNETWVLGLFAIVINDTHYGLLNANALVQLDPSSTNMVTIGEDQYYELVFDKGSCVIANTNLVKQDTMLYEVFNEIIAKGRIPWYMSYEDVGKLFVTARYHAGVRLSANNSIIEMIVATMTRVQKDRTKYYRHSIASMDEQYTHPPAFIPLRSPIYGATNTTAKIIGAYFDDSLTSALVNPSEKVEGVEKLLRS